MLDKLEYALRQGDLRYPPWRGHPTPWVGACYIASEALYWSLGGPDGCWRPMFIRHEGVPHWYLQDDLGQVLDLTSGQFGTRVPYDDGRGKGFLTSYPSLRALILMGRMQLFHGMWRWALSASRRAPRAPGPPGRSARRRQ